MRLNNSKEEWQTFLWELIQEDPEAQQFCLTDSQINILSKKWEEVICTLYPDSSNSLLHSIRELCDIGDTDKKAAICFRICGRDWKLGQIDLGTIQRNLYPILNRIKNSQGIPNPWKARHNSNTDEDCQHCFPAASTNPKSNLNGCHVGVPRQVCPKRPELLRNQSQDISDTRCSKRQKSSHKGLALHRIFNKGGIQKTILMHDVNKKRMNNIKKCLKRGRVVHDIRRTSLSLDSGSESDSKHDATKSADETAVFACIELGACILIKNPGRKTSHQTGTYHKSENFIRKYNPIVSEEQKNEYKAKYKKHYMKFLKLHQIFEQTSEKLKMFAPGSEEWQRIVGDYNQAKEFNKSKKATSQFSIYEQLQYLTKKLKHIRRIIDDHDLKRISNLYEKFKDILTEHHSWILETLLPSHALPLTDALQTIYLEDKEKKAFETLLLLKRYSSMFYTNMDTAELILKNLSENKQVDTKEIKNGIPSEFLQGSCFVYDVVLSQQLPGNDVEKGTLKDGILKILKQIGTDSRLRQWLYQLHKQKAASYGWEPLSDFLTEEDFSRTSIHIPDIFYGGVTHVPVLVKFSCPSDTSYDEALLDRLDKLNQLYRIALENLDSILHKDREIRIENGVLYLQPKNEEKEDTVIIKQVREIWGRAKHDPTYRDMLVEKLQENNIPFYATEDILDILSSETNDDVDTLEVGVWKIDLKGQKTTLIAGTLIWPKMMRRLSELDNTFLPELHRRFAITIPSWLNKSIGQGLILNLTIYQDQELLQEAWSFLERNESILLNLLVHFRSNNGTLKGLLTGLNECKRKDNNLTNAQNEEKNKVVIALILDIKVFIEEKHTEWMEKFDQRIPCKITSRRSFLTFLENHEISQFPKMNTEEFKEKLRQEEIMDGDQVWFWRKALGMNYAHVGIFVKNLNNTRLNGFSLASGYIIHVQPRKYRKLQAKIVYEPVENAVHRGDELFVVQAENETEGLSRDQIRGRAIKCCHPKIIFNYDSYFGSCETFASKICRTNNLSELNIQGLKVAIEHQNEGRTKRFFAAHLHGIQTSGNLLEKLERRLVEPSIEDLENSNSLMDGSESSVTMSDISEDMDVDDIGTRPLDMPIFPTDTTEIMRQGDGTVLEDPENDKFNSLRAFLSRIKLSELENLFINEGVTMEILTSLSDHNLKEDIGVKKFGDRWTIINELSDPAATPSSDLGNSIRSVSDSGCSVRSVDSVNINQGRNQGNLFVYRPGPCTTPNF